MPELDYQLVVNELQDELKIIQNIFSNFVKSRIIKCTQKIETRDKVLVNLILYHPDLKNHSVFFLKPRFHPAVEMIPHDNRNRIIHIFDRLKDHFQEYSFYQLSDSFAYLFCMDSKDQNYKYSLFCLAEGEEYRTDQIYGDYDGVILIKDQGYHASIYAVRREEIREIICQNQDFSSIQDVFTFLTTYVVSRIQEEISNRIAQIDSVLQHGIENYAILKEKFPQISPFTNLLAILDLGKRRLLVNPFEGLFYLGYCMEMWIKNYVFEHFQYDADKKKLFYILKTIETNKWLPTSEIDICHQIRIAYNFLRHNPDYIPDYKTISALYQEFSNIISIYNKN